MSQAADDPGRRQISRLCIGDSDGIDELLVRYAPQLVVLPEDIERGRPPGPRTEHDYHPRSARMFVDIARTVAFDADSVDTVAGDAGAGPPRDQALRPPWMWRFSTNVGRTLELLDVARILALTVLAASAAGAMVGGEPGLLVGGLLVAISVLILGAIGDRADRRNLPQPGGDGVRRHLESVWPGHLMRERLTIPGRVDGRSTWRLYRRLVRSGAARYPRTVYGRTVQAGDMVAVQYWLFFFYNAWYNLHEADWELITVLHDPRTNTPQSVCASAHGSGARLLPEQLTWHGDQPVIYVAAGSHALYFRPETGVSTSGVASRASVRGASRPIRLGAGSTRDWVADVGPDRCLDLPSVPYELLQLPDVDRLEPGADRWDTWWWLAYGGGWGRVRPIPGPAYQGARWADPGGWAIALPMDQPATEYARPVF